MRDQIRIFEYACLPVYQWNVEKVFYIQGIRFSDYEKFKQRIYVNAYLPVYYWNV